MFTIAATETTMAMLDTATSKAPMMMVPDLKLVQPYILKAKYTNPNTNTQKLQIHKYTAMSKVPIMRVPDLKLVPSRLNKHSKLKNMLQQERFEQNNNSNSS